MSPPRTTTLFNLAHARAGDKGDLCNVGVIARRPEYYPILVRELGAERVKAFFGPWCRGRVERFERRYGTFSRTFSLPPTVDAGKVAAEYKDGVLTVKLPVREEAKPRQVKVEVAA